MSIQNLFSERLKALRLKHDLSQRQLGLDIGIDESTASPRMNQYERGIHLPDLTTSKHLADRLDVPMAYFYCPEPELADILLVLHKMPIKKRQALLKQLKQDFEDE